MVNGSFTKVVLKFHGNKHKTEYFEVTNHLLFKTSNTQKRLISKHPKELTEIPESSSKFQRAHEHPKELIKHPKELIEYPHELITSTQQSS